MKSQSAILPLVDLVFLALGGVLACMTQMEVIRALPVEVSQVGKGSAMPQHDTFKILTLTSDGMTLGGEPIMEEDLISKTANEKIILRAQRQLPTQYTVSIIAKLAEAGADVSIEIEEINDELNR